MKRWLLVLLALPVGFILLSMAAFLSLPWITQSLTPKIGTTIIYELVNIKPHQDAAAMAEKTVRILNRRFKVGRHSLAIANVTSENRIEIGVFGTDPQNVEEVESIVSENATLEFRIVANRKKHKEEIELAEREPGKAIFLDLKGEWTARWLPVKKGLEIPQAETIVRDRQIDGATVHETLVVRDPYDVTGEYLTRARPDIDSNTGQPCISFELDSVGGKLFGELTEDNRSQTDDRESMCYLAVIIDETIYSAPTLRGKITNRGMITGNFTPQEIRSFSNRLNAGMLPVKMRKIEERSAEMK